MRKTGFKVTVITALLAFAVIFVSVPVNFGNDAVVTAEAKTKKFSLSDVPAYSGDAYVEINGNKPYFTAKEKKNIKSFESYHKLDKLGRCGVAYANVCTDTMPTEERGFIGSVKPTGWHTTKYNGVVDGNYVYNRCHLIAYCLTAENANKKNLITGTRYLNIEGMPPFETKVAKYIEKTGNHVLYRVTPCFKGNNLLASGVLMEGYSIEDKGKGIKFCIYTYNVQPHIKINYKTGDTKVDSSTASSNSEKTDGDSKQTYIVNTSSQKFHKSGCSAASSISPKNKKQYKGKRSSLINNGYSPCKICNP